MLSFFCEAFHDLGCASRKGGSRKDVRWKRTLCDHFVILLLVSPFFFETLLEGVVCTLNICSSSLSKEVHGLCSPCGRQSKQKREVMMFLCRFFVMPLTRCDGAK